MLRPYCCIPTNSQESLAVWTRTARVEAKTVLSFVGEGRRFVCNRSEIEWHDAGPGVGDRNLGTIQDDKLSKIAPTLTDDGFLQRFATVMIRKTGRGDDIPDNRDLDSSVPRVASRSLNWRRQIIGSHPMRPVN